MINAIDYLKRYKIQSILIDAIQVDIQQLFSYMLLEDSYKNDIPKMLEVVKQDIAILEKEISGASQDDLLKLYKENKEKLDTLPKPDDTKFLEKAQELSNSMFNNLNPPKNNDNTPTVPGF